MMMLLSTKIKHDSTIGGRGLLHLTFVGMLFYLALVSADVDAADESTSSSLDHISSSSSSSRVNINENDEERLLKPLNGGGGGRMRRAAKYNKKTDVPMAQCNAKLFEGMWTYQSPCGDTMNVNISCNDETDICLYTEFIVDFADENREPQDYCPVGGKFQDRTSTNVYHDKDKGICIIEYFDLLNDPCNLYENSTLGTTMYIPMVGGGDTGFMYLLFSNNGGASYYNIGDQRVAIRGQRRHRDLVEGGYFEESSWVVTDPVVLKQRRLFCEQLMGVSLMPDLGSIFTQCTSECLVAAGTSCITCILRQTYPPIIEGILSQFDRINLGSGVEQTVNIPVPGCPTDISVSFGVSSITGLSSINFDGVREVGVGTFTAPAAGNCPRMWDWCIFPCYEDGGNYCRVPLTGDGPPGPGRFSGTWTDTLRLPSLAANTQASLNSVPECLSSDPSLDATLVGTTSWNDASLQVTLSFDGEFDIIRDQYITLSEIKLDSIDVVLGTLIIGIDASAWGDNFTSTREFEQSFNLAVPEFIDNYIQGTIVDGVNDRMESLLPLTFP